MKKLSRMLALSLATAMVFGMTVSAAPSVSTENSSVTSDTLQEAANSVVVDNAAVEVKSVVVAVYDSAAKATPDAAVVGEGAETQVVTAFDVVVTEDTQFPLTITFNKVPGISASKTYVVLHQLADGSWETLPAKVEGSSITATFNSLSPVAIVEVVKAGDVDDDSDDDDDDDDEVVVATDGTIVAPKTGETLPVVGIMAVICLAGAALSAKKVRSLN